MTDKAQQEWAELIRPFPFDGIELRPQSLIKTNDGDYVTKPIAYFNARHVMNRLDKVLGPERWQVSEPQYGMVGQTAYCKVCLTVALDGGVTLTRWGEAETTNIHAIKGGASDALKRAFAALGNRGLYNCDFGWYKFEGYERNGKVQFKKFPDHERERMRKFYDANVSKQFDTFFMEPEGE